jgi:Skp family chaperone for outer membrane proteins
MRGAGAAAAVAVALWGTGAAAQGFSLGETVGEGAGTPGPDAFPLARPESPVLTLDQERLFAGSAFGQRVADELQAASAELAQQNRRIEQDLTQEERALTEQRDTLSTEEFRARADAFDARVVALRRQQDAKAVALQRREEAERQAFLRAALPLLADLLADLGAVAILDDRAVLFAAGAIDITDRAIRRIDAEIGAGAALSPPGPIFSDLPGVDEGGAPLPDDAPAPGAALPEPAPDAPPPGPALPDAPQP